MSLAALHDRVGAVLRGGFALLIGGLAVCLGLSLWAAAPLGLVPPDAWPTLSSAVLGATVAALLAAVLVRPREAWLLEFGLLPLAAGGALVSLTRALLEPVLARALFSVALVASGGLAVLLAGSAILRARALRRAVGRASAFVGPVRRRRERGEGTELVDADALSSGDELLLLPGEVLAADGVVLRGAGLVDESAVLGGPARVSRGPQDVLLAGTVSCSGELVVRVFGPASASFLAASRRAASRLAGRLELPSTRDRLVGGLTLLAALTVLALGVLRGPTLEWTRALEWAAGVALALVAGAPAAARVAWRAWGLARCRRAGVHLCRLEALDALASVESFELEPALIEAGRRVEVFAAGAARRGELLAVAEALLEGAPAALRDAVRAERMRLAIEARTAEAPRRQHAGFEGMIEGSRWRLTAPAEAAEAAATLAPPSSPLGEALRTLEARGDHVLLLEREGEGAVGLVGVGALAHVELARRLAALGARLAGDPRDPLLGALARANGLELSAARADRRTGCLVPEGSKPRGDGVTLTVAQARPGAVFAELEGAILFPPALEGLGALVAELRVARARASRQALALLVLPPLAAALALFGGALGPGTGLAIGAAALLAAGLDPGPTAAPSSGQQ
jgi:cation transport ATPase